MRKLLYTSDPFLPPILLGEGFEPINVHVSEDNELVCVFEGTPEIIQFGKDLQHRLFPKEKLLLGLERHQEYAQKLPTSTQEIIKNLQNYFFKKVLKSKSKSFYPKKLFPND